MSSRKTTLFYGLLIAVASLAVGMVIASRLDLSPTSSAQTLAMPPMNSAPLEGTISASTFRSIAQAVSPAVVNIRTESRQSPQLTEFFGGGDDLFDRFFGDGGQNRERQNERERIAVAAGTGFVIGREGYILTNNHVVEDATKIEVSFYGDAADVSYDASVIGRDPLTDSALIQLTEKPARELVEVKFGDSEQMLPGDWVLAIGNPFGLAHTVSVGVISATERSFPVADGRFADVLQTDAAINPGNSGGPLLNVRGEVVGINTAIYSDPRQQGNIGIGFAMPINVVRELLPQLRTGKVTRGVIGVSISDVPSDAVDAFGLTEKRGALITTVAGDGPAAKAGVKPGDVIVEYNGKPILQRDELVSMVVATKPGTTVPITVMRAGQEMTLKLTVEELSLESEAARTTRRGGEPQEAEDAEAQGFGVTLSQLTPDIARRLRVPPDTEGVLVSEVEPGSSAQRSGIVAGDVILEVNREVVTSPQAAGRALDAVRSGSTAFFLILRGGQETFVTVRKQ